MQDQIYFLNQNLALLLIIAASLLFAVIGILYSRKHQGLSNYLTADRNVGTTSLTTSFCLLYTSPSPRDGLLSRMPSSA